MGVLAKAAGSLWDWIEAGYPEEVARRIVSGELPMDEASRMARASEQGYGDVLYHGSTNPDMKEIAPMEVGKRNATGGNGLFLTDNPRVASTYAYDARVNGGKGPEGGTVYPLRVRDAGPDNWVTVKDRGHRGEEYSTFWDEIPVENIRGMDTDIYEPGQYLETDQINRAANRQGKKLVEYTNIYDSGEDVYSVGGTEVPSNVTAVLDNTLVRSPNAAYDPQYSGPNIMGGLLAGGVGLGALSQSEDADAGFVTRGGKTLLEAFHGSPHKFDKFSMDQIGTGEGAQAYGHGLYFADEIDVAKQYRDSIVNHRPPNMRVDGKGYGDMSGPEYRASAAIESEFRSDPMIDIDTAYARALRELEYQKSMANKPELYDEDIDALKNLKGRVDLDKGHLYRAEIDATPESLLDWDKPLSEQSDYVKEAFKKIPQGQVEITPNAREGSYWVKGKNWRGGNVNRVARGLEQAERVAAKARGIDLNSQGDMRAGALIENAVYDQRETLSNTLREAGIPGIKYLDGDSRAVGDGTSNYVIFDDSLINIAERGNATVPALGVLATGTGAALAAPALKSEGLEKATGFLDETIRSARHAAGPLSFLVPYEGISNFAKKWNADEDLTWQDYLGLLDF